MVLLTKLGYISHNSEYVTDLYNIYYNYDLTEKNIINLDNLDLNLIDNKFCRHIIKKGSRDERICCIIDKTNSGLCKRHSPKNIVIKCSGKTIRNKKCRRNVKNTGTLCIYCIKKNVNKYECKINSRQLFLIENPIEYTNSLLPYYNKNYFGKSFAFFINNFINNLNKYKISLEFIYNIFYMFSKIVKLFQIHQTNNVNKMNMQLILSEKKHPVYLFDKNIYKHLNTKTDKLYNTLKKFYNSDSSNILNILSFNNDNAIIKYYDINKKIKKYILNKKKKLRKKNKQLQKLKPDINFQYEVINVKILNEPDIIKIIDCGFLNIKLWPCNYESYKDFIPYKIYYFHNYHNIQEKDDTKVVLFYKINNKFNYKRITYNNLYNLLIKEYNSISVYDYIKTYYKKFNP